MTNPKEKTIGIIGGAGPMAGALLVKKIIEYCQRSYGCINDYDYPKIILFSYPFSEMLKPNTKLQNNTIIVEQLKYALDFLNKCQANYIGIACNTLHGFLDTSENSKQTINLVFEVKSSITKLQYKRILLLCTSTSMQKSVYDSSAMTILDKRDQRYLDELIKKILGGSFSLSDSLGLKDFILSKTSEYPDLDAVLLGCTELSVLINEFPLQLSKIHLIDPLDILADKLCNLIFMDKENG